MKPTRERERKAPRGMYHGSIQLTNWEARIVASTISFTRDRPSEAGQNCIAVLVTYPNDDAVMVGLTAGEFRSLAWIDCLHADAITFVTDDVLRRRIVEAIQLQGVPELMDTETFDRVCEELSDKICDEGRGREGYGIAFQDIP